MRIATYAILVTALAFAVAGCDALPSLTGTEEPENPSKSNSVPDMSGKWKFTVFTETSNSASNPQPTLELEQTNCGDFACDLTGDITFSGGIIHNEFKVNGTWYYQRDILRLRFVFNTSATSPLDTIYTLDEKLDDETWLGYAIQFDRTSPGQDHRAGTPFEEPRRLLNQGTRGKTVAGGRVVAQWVSGQ